MDLDFGGATTPVAVADSPAGPAKSSAEDESRGRRRKDAVSMVPE